MYQRILFPTDGSAITDKAMVSALELAKLAGAQLQVLAVKEPYPYSALSETQPIDPQQFTEGQEKLAQARLQKAREAAAASGVPCQTSTIEAYHPWEAIIQQARTSHCDLIVMASHGRRGVSALLLGSETQKVLTHSTLPVLVVR
jgi:nucleotide-binding universal stress UspA family protein